MTWNVFWRKSPSTCRNDAISWQEIAEKKRESLHRKIPVQWLLSKALLDEAKNRTNLTGSYIEKLLDPKTREITSMDSTELVRAMKDGILTAVAVVTAFCERAAFAHQLNNCLLEIMFETAIKRAEELDKHFSQTGELIGPLHGLPVSLKDQFHVKGGETTLGYVGWIHTFEGITGTGKEGIFESELVRGLISAGAIPIAKTSLAQTLWCAENNNNIMGYNWNPHNQNLSSGGSSGGQGAFQALRGTTIGFGTDIGGSVSVPAAFNGVYSIKPSQGRLSFRGVPNSSPGQSTIPTAIGVLGTSLSCLRLGLMGLTATRPWLRDPDVLQIPWNEDVFTEIQQRSSHGTLCFGMLDDDGIVAPHPPVLRAMSIVKQALTANGFKTIAWRPPSHQEAEDIHAAILTADGFPDVIERLKLSGEPPIVELQDHFNDQPRASMPLPKFYDWTLKLKDYRQRYQDYWLSTSEFSSNGQEIDAVILPIAPHAAVIPGKWYHFAYGSIANVLDRPTVVIPVTFADSQIDKFNVGYEAKNEKDRLNWLAYDPVTYHGAPVAIQILGKRFEEERLLALAQVIVEAIKGDTSHL